MENAISAITHDDLSQVLELASELGYPVPLRELESRFLELSCLPHHTLLKYEDKNKILGWIHLEVVNDLIEETKLEIKAIIVSESARGKGVGHLLIEEAKIQGKSLGLNTIYLSCNILRERTHAFYKREGFSLSKTSHFFELKL